VRPGSAQKQGRQHDNQAARRARARNFDDSAHHRGTIGVGASRSSHGLNRGRSSSALRAPKHGVSLCRQLAVSAGVQRSWEFRAPFCLFQMVTVMNANLMQLQDLDHSRRPALSPEERSRPAWSESRLAPRGIVLIVDDHRDAADSLAMLIELTGVDAYVAYDGLEAVELAQRLRPDFIFMDLSMPRMNGVEATLHIRREPWGRRIPICALTALDDPSSRAATRAAGFDHHLRKPASFDEIDALLPTRLSSPARMAGQSA